MARLMLALTAFVVCFAFLNARRISKRSVTATEQQTIVDDHNAKRREVQLTAAGIGKAANMQLMVWDDDLAILAQNWATNCYWGHRPSADRNIASLPGVTVGENLAKNNYANIDWADAVGPWYNEISNFAYNASNGKVNQAGTTVGHFSQVVRAESGKIGCGFAVCNQTDNFFVCNYALGQSNYNLPYVISSTSCSACSSNCNNNLCNCSGKVCARGGVLNVGTCTCACPTGTQGDICETLSGCGEDDNDPSYCGPASPYGFPESFCTLYSNVPQLCPKMCNQCT